MARRFTTTSWKAGWSFSGIHSQLPDRPHLQIDEAAVKLLFRILFIRLAQCSVHPCDGAHFDADPVLDDPRLRIDDGVVRDVLLKLSGEATGRPIDYSQIDPRVLGNIYERFPGCPLEVEERRPDPQAGRRTRRKAGTFYTPRSVTKFPVETPSTRP